MDACQAEIQRLRGVVRELESEVEELRNSEMKLSSQIDCYEDELKKVLSKYFTDELVSMIMKDLEAD